MIFSKRIYKLIDGVNPTLFQEDENVLNLYIFNKSLKKYRILAKDKTNCVFIKHFNFEKIIQLDNNILCPYNKNHITIINENEV